MSYFERETVTVAAAHPGAADDSRVRRRSVQLRAAREAKARMEEDQIPMQEFSGAPLAGNPAANRARLPSGPSMAEAAEPMTEEATTLRTDPEIQRELITDLSIPPALEPPYPHEHRLALPYEESEPLSYYPAPHAGQPSYYPEPHAGQPSYYPEPLPQPSYSPPSYSPASQEQDSQAQSYAPAEPLPQAPHYPAPDASSDVELFDPPSVFGDMPMAAAQPIALTVPLPAYTEPLLAHPEPHHPEPAPNPVRYNETSFAPIAIAIAPPPRPAIAIAPSVPPSPWPTPASPLQPRPVQSQYLPPGYARPALERTYQTNERGNAMRFVSIGFAGMALVLLVAGSSALYSYLTRTDSRAAAPAPATSVAAAKASSPRTGIPEVDVMHLPKVGVVPIIEAAPPRMEAPAPPPPIAKAPSTQKSSAPRSSTRHADRVREERPREATADAEQDEPAERPAKGASVASAGKRVKTARGAMVVPALPTWGAARHYSDDDEPATGGLFLDQRTLSGIKGLDKAFSAD